MGALGSIGNWFKSLGGWIMKLFSSVEQQEVGFVQFFLDIKNDCNAFVMNLKNFESFDFDPKWKTRVINVPRAIDGFQQLWDIVRNDLVDKFSVVVDKLKVIEETLSGSTNEALGEGPSAAGNAVSKLATISILAGNFKDALHEALDIESTLVDLKNRVESLDDLFLPQDKSRKWQTVHIRQRV